MNKNIFDNVKKVHFIGIGGSGMFPLAQILKSKGFEITGSDVNESYIIDMERKLNITVYMGHKEENILGADLIVYSAAIMNDNVELLAAKNFNIPIMERAKLLGLLASEKNDCIGICGTHGKTTTTSLITHILLSQGKDPSAIIGGKLEEIGGNARVGKSEIMVCEACEYVDTFLNIFPRIAVILNIDEDHMEYFKTLDNVIKSYNKFCENTRDLVICNGDDENINKAINNIGKSIITFGFSENNDYYAKNIEFNGYKNNKFDVYKNNNKLMTVTLNVPGKHNIMNCLAAIVVCLEEGCKCSGIIESIKTFGGASRRFEFLGECGGAMIADDYAHHPKEIGATLNAAKTLGFSKIFAIFQPFTFSRTYMLLDDFAKVLSEADEVLLTPIMGSREVNTYNIYSEDLANKIKNAKVYKNFDEIANYIKNNAKSGDLVLTMGCGDVYKCAYKILN